MISHVDGRPGNMSRVRGRREGLVSTAPSQDASSVEHLGELRDPYQAARFINAATPVSSISEGLVFFHEGDILMLHEYTGSLPELMSRGVLPRGPAGGRSFSTEVPIGCIY